MSTAVVNSLESHPIITRGVQDIRDEDLTENVLDHPVVYLLLYTASNPQTLVRNIRFGFEHARININHRMS